MLNVTLNDKTAKMLESYRRAKRLSREQALEKLLEEVTQRQAFQNVLSVNWSKRENQTDITLEADLNAIIKQDRASNTLTPKH
jgi:parvulin-like peptidyl-prolyl isomerase